MHIDEVEAAAERARAATILKDHITYAQEAIDLLNGGMCSVTISVRTGNSNHTFTTAMQTATRLAVAETVMAATLVIASLQKRLIDELAKV